MKNFLIAIILSTFFVALGIIILLEQYLNFGVWFQLKDIHHETFALSSFALAIGILIGSNFPKNSDLESQLDYKKIELRNFSRVKSQAIARDNQLGLIVRKEFASKNGVLCIYYTNNLDSLIIR